MSESARSVRQPAAIASRKRAKEQIILVVPVWCASSPMPMSEAGTSSNRLLELFQAELQTGQDKLRQSTEQDLSVDTRITAAAAAVLG